MRRAIALGGCLLCGSALADEGVRWQYTAPPECPSEQEFRAQVRARLLGEPRASEPTGGAAVTVEVRLEPGERRASLVLREGGTPVVERTVEGDSCAELASGLALIAALAFGAAREPTTAGSATAPAGPAAPAAPSASAEPPRVTEPPRAKLVEEPAPTPWDRGRTRPTASAAPLGMEAGAGGWVNGWTSPGVTLGGDLFLRLGPREPWAWSLRAAGAYGVGTSTVDGRAAKFTLVAGRAEGCPLALRLPLTLSAEPCLALDLGTLRGEGDAGSALLEGASRTLFWADAVAVGRVRKRFGRRVSLEGQVELGVPLTPHEFVFENPAQRIFRTPPVGLAGRLGLGVELL